MELKFFLAACLLLLIFNPVNASYTYGSQGYLYKNDTLIWSDYMGSITAADRDYICSNAGMGYRSDSIADMWGRNNYPAFRQLPTYPTIIAGITYNADWTNGTYVTTNIPCQYYARYPFDWYDSTIWTPVAWWMYINKVREVSANFTGTNLTGPAPLTVRFTDRSTGLPTSWLWTFGDGGVTSTLRNPLKTYTKAGTYTVTLTVANGTWNDTKVRTGYVTVTASVPVANFTGTNLSGAAPLTVRFTDRSTNTPTSWLWTFGDGGKSSTLKNPIKTYAKAGTYTVSLTATNAAGNNTKVRTGYVRVTEEVANCGYPTDPYINFTIHNVNYPECTPAGTWQGAVCYDNAVIRWALAGDSTSSSATLSPWMWKRYYNCPDPGYSFAVAQPYNKAIYIAGECNPDIPMPPDNNPFYHAITAEYLTGGDPGSSTWGDWKFFQYDNTNIQKGNWQIPAGTSVCHTKMWIRSVTSVSDCGSYNGPIKKIFYIDSNNNIQTSQLGTCYGNCGIEQTAKVSINSQNIPIELQEELKSMNDYSQFSIDKWEYDPVKKEVTFYAYDIRDQQMIDGLQNKSVGYYTRHIVHDTEFEANREDVQRKLNKLRKNPEYHIRGISMVTDAFGDPSGNYAELWVDKSTPENKELDNTMIQGWKILVYPVS